MQLSRLHGNDPDTRRIRAADRIKIGFSMPLTGGLAGRGRSALLAIEVGKQVILYPPEYKSGIKR